jgi:signal recognition particle receptor subunit beta
LEGLEGENQIVLFEQRMNEEIKAAINKKNIQVQSTESIKNKQAEKQLTELMEQANNSSDDDL